VHEDDSYQCRFGFVSREGGRGEGGMKAPSFRLYKYVDERFQFMGLRIEQVVLIIASLLLFFIFDDILKKTMSLVFGVFGFFSSKKFSKKICNLSLKSYINWHFGLSPNLGDKFPKSSTRRIVGE